MNAKEMWEELEYTYRHTKTYENEKLISDLILIKKFNDTLSIDVGNKKVNFRTQYTGSYIINFIWNEGEIKAFTQTLKELGWIE